MHRHYKHLIASKKFRIVAFGVLACVLIGGIIVLMLRTPAGPSLSKKDLGVVLTDYTGKEVKFSQFTSGFSRKPLVVYFWATWCPYCNAEFTQLAELKQQYGDSIQVVAVNRGESVQYAEDYTSKLALGSGIVYLLDSGDSLFKLLGGYAMPETIFTNANGEELFHKHGPISADEIVTAAKQITH